MLSLIPLVNWPIPQVFLFVVVVVVFVKVKPAQHYSEPVHFDFIAIKAYMRIC
uniref:Uncharacterized protein n=1 Tax=Anguilla anguilla TaxID=7936 RepID=A0A0E9XHK7_ANGAN